MSYRYSDVVSLLFSSTENTDLGGVESLVKRSLNKLTEMRLVPMQEAVHEVMVYDLTLTSETFTRISLSSCQKLITNKQKKDVEAKSKQDVVTMYRNRGP